MWRFCEWEKATGVALMILGLLGAAACGDDAPPLPTHQVEGNSGVFITPTAVVVHFE